MFVSGLAAGSALAANPLIADAQESFDILDLEGARETLAQALASPGNSDGDFKAIYSLLGQTYVLLDEPDQAEKAFTNLLAYDRDYELPAGTPDQIQEVFERVKASAPAHIARPAGGAAPAARPPESAPADDFGSSTGDPIDDFGSSTSDAPPADDFASLEAEAAADDPFGDSTDSGAPPPAGGDDFDLASLEAEAAAAMQGEGGGNVPPAEDLSAGGGADDPFGDDGTTETETLSAFGTGGTEVVKVYPPQMREVSKDAPVELEVDLDDLQSVTQRVVMYYRQEGSASGFSTVEGQPLQPAKFFIKIPWIWDLAVGDELALDYYINALGAGDHVVGSYGNMGTPHVLRATLGRGMDKTTTVVQQGEDPIYKKAWFWGLIGGVVAAGTATGLIVGLWPEETKVAGGALGKEKLSK